MFGYKSNWFAVPAAGVGAVVLTNSDKGYALTDAVKRRLLELLYDGKPEAAADVAGIAERSKASLAKFRSEVWSCRSRRRPRTDLSQTIQTPTSVRSRWPAMGPS